MRVEADGGARGSTSGRTLVDPGSADPAGDPGAHRHHQRDGARRADLRRSRRAKSSSASTAACSSPTTRASTTASSSTSSRALERAFTARVLCTVRLSRRLYPERDGHGLDALIARHGARHVARAASRARRRARDLAFVQMLYRELDARARSRRRSSACCGSRACRRSLPPDALDALPEGAGRLSASTASTRCRSTSARASTCASASARISRSDWRSETDLRLSQEIRRIELEETAGELGALLREAALVKALLPAHNRALRRKAEAGVLTLGDDGAPRYIPAAGDRRARSAGRYGPFASRAAMRAMRCARSPPSIGCAGGAWGSSGAQPGRASRGSCSAATASASARRRPERTTTRARERARAAAHSARGPRRAGARARGAPSGERVDVHVIRDWCWLGTARDDGELAALLEAPPRAGVRPRRHAAAAAPRTRAGSSRSRCRRPPIDASPLQRRLPR